LKKVLDTVFWCFFEKSALLTAGPQHHLAGATGLLAAYYGLQAG
jgi:hypothetical protein